MKITLKRVLAVMPLFLLFFLTGKEVKADTNDGFTYPSAYGWWNETGYDANKIAERTVSGDFNGDGKEDVAAMYDYGNGESRIHVFLSTGSSFSYPSGYGWWSETGYDAGKLKGRMVAGDFNGDGKDDIAGMYDYGNGESRIHVFLSTGSSFSYPSAYGWWNETGYDANKITGRMVAGDFNGDGKDDIAGMYDYGNGESRIHVFLSTGSSFSYQSAYGWWNETGYDANKITGRMVAGDFNGDGKDDIAGMYDYGNGESRIHMFLSTGSSFSYPSAYGWWNETGYDANKITDRMVAGDFNGDGKDDIAGMYDYGSGESRIHMFLSTGSSFSYPSAYGWWHETGYDAKRVAGRMVAGNFNGTGGEDIATIYDYGNSESRVHIFLSNSTSSPSSKADVEKLLNVARNEIGYHEIGNNWTKYGAWYPMQNQPWCAMFVSWCANQAGISTDIIPKHALCQTGANWFMNRGLWNYRGSYTPKPGDIIYFYYSGAINHVGIVESVSDSYVQTIEGNTSDQVARRTYSFGDSRIAGYGSPQYTS
ncbi:FG-GAP-like repeat-containing protein [Clostridium cibarium]|uniref:VCBS repeat-containing protein n=1 Tax=Clostridium cibarium TaxID=2762247 RepID=A0ABR8PRL6_9CLOT|nr:FG-GAP-like repeat-containing protein [Clostridium cibarium]MBD7910802.1 VCBS repeat-containing protein [Clostridium cibarium]